VKFKVVFSAVVLKDTDIFAINVGFLGGGGGKYISKGVGNWQSSKGA